MVQWMDVYWNNSFVNWTRLPLFCEKSGAIPLVLNTGRFEIFLYFCKDLTKEWCYHSVTNVLGQVFR